MTTITADVCVIGAGPAGSALAIRLAQLGHSIVVVERAVFPRPHVGESLVSAVLPVLGVLGVRREIEQAGFLRPTHSILRWPQAAEWRDGSGEAGFQVDRGRFDAILLTRAATAGVRVLQPASVTGAVYRDDTWEIKVDAGAEEVTVRCRMLADGAGRTGWLEGRKTLMSEKTLAMYGYWGGVPLQGAGTRVEAGDRQWYWGAPLPHRLFVAAVFVDPSDYRNGSRTFGSRTLFYEHLMARSALLSDCLRGRRTSPVFACDATAYRDELPATPRSIKVGESAFAIDPLSSQGIQTALGSALHAAAAVHTILERPGDGDLAVEFYRRRQLEATAFHARAAAELYHEIVDFQSSGFWSRRAARNVDSSDTVPRPFAGPLTTRMVVQLAHEVHFEEEPVLRGDFITRGQGVVIPGAGRSTAFLGDVELAPLLEAARAPIGVESLVDRWTRIVPHRHAVAILEWLWTRGVIENCRLAIDDC